MSRVRSSTASTPSFHPSARNGRVSKFSIAWSTLVRSSRMAATALAIGISMPFSFAISTSDRRGEGAFGELRSGLRDPCVLAFAERDAEREIARLRTRTGQDKVAKTGQSGQGLRPRAERLAEAEQLSEPARGQRRCRAGAEPAAGNDAGGDREHVLGGAADLDAAHVARMIGPERARSRARGRARWRRPRRRAASVTAVGSPRATSAGEARAREDCRQARIGAHLADHFGHEFVRAALDALGAGDHRRAGGKRRRDRSGRGAQMPARGPRAGWRQAAAISASAATTRDALVQLDAGQMRALARWQRWRRRRPRRARQSVTSRPARAIALRERSAPGAGSDHGDALECSCAVRAARLQMRPRCPRRHIGRAASAPAARCRAYR